MDDLPSLQIAGLSLWAVKREFEDSEDYWDGNWLDVSVCLDAPGCHLEVAGPWLRTDEIARFADQLAILTQDLRGQAELSGMEPYLDVKVVCGSRGQVAVTVELRPDLVAQWHHVEFAIDQTYLGDTLLGCRRLLDQFPVRGSPPSG